MSCVDTPFFTIFYSTTALQHSVTCCDPFRCDLPSGKESVIDIFGARAQQFGGKLVGKSSKVKLIQSVLSRLIQWIISYNHLEEHLCNKEIPKSSGDSGLGPFWGKRSYRLKVATMLRMCRNKFLTPQNVRLYFDLLGSMV